ncbi:MAG: hemerythrin family protein [Candidatus Competibacteraceae bacterium]|nr:hemerythrin family protein [Candidatus Competibacteraceae bacterium]
MSTTQEYITWSKELSVGIQELDEQHKILIGLINQLYNEAILKKPDHSIISGIFNELAQYTIIHFSVEESLFRIFDYLNTDAHQQHHEQLKETLSDIQNKFHQGAPVTLELMSFLRQWLKQHIMKDDKQYQTFFLEKGFNADWSKKRSWVGKIWDSIYLK